MAEIDWLGKPYYSLNAFFRHTYGQKVYKIAVDAGLTCPNRDGSLDERGCIFCSAGGSGDFAVGLYDGLKAENSPYSRVYDRRSCAGKTAAERRVMDVSRQIERGMARFNKSVGEKFVIYFQAYTNTYGDIDYLRAIWTAALESEQVAGISIATRPDCLGIGDAKWQEKCRGVLPLLAELKEKYEPQGKFIWVELGLQTIHETTAEYIRRGYPRSVYEEAVHALADIGIPYITHIILGLPGETREMMLDTVRYVNSGNGCPPAGIKLQLLHVLRGTALADELAAGRIQPMEMETYIDLVIDCLACISPDVVIHRLTGDGPKNLLIAPAWSANKKVVLNTLNRRLEERGIRQGDAIGTNRFEVYNADVTSSFRE